MCNFFLFKHVYMPSYPMCLWLFFLELKLAKLKAESTGWGGWIGSMDEAVESDGWLVAEIEEGRIWIWEDPEVEGETGWSGGAVMEWMGHLPRF